MPRLTELHLHCCNWCGRPATFISVKTKIYRCVEKITQCPAVIQKQETARQCQMTTEMRREHMKKMSRNGNARLQELHENEDWVSQKGSRISNKVKERGGHLGTNNPMSGKKHSPESIEKLKKKAKDRDPLCYVKCTETKIERGIAIPKDQKTDYELYEEAVDTITLRSWLKHYWDINPNNLTRGSEYELDHKYSKAQGWINKIPPEIIGHYCNLELLPKNKNRSKRTKCSITLEELIETTSRFPH